MRTIIVYEDKNLIVACKPAGLATQTSKVGQADMVSELKNYLNGAYLGIVHRLDQPVEGLLAFGKTREASAELTRQLARGSLHKRYYCVVLGEPAAADGELTDYLCKTSDNCAEIVPESQAEERQAQRAVLRYRILESLSISEILQKQAGTKDAQTDREDRISLAEIVIKTGRFHQIRAQMAHAGMPLLGDTKYGTERSGELSAELRVKNVALCAYDLQLRHPIKKNGLHFQVEPKAEVFHLFSKINHG